MKWYIVRYITIGQGGAIKTAMQKARSAISASGRFYSSDSNIIILSAEEFCYDH